MHLELIAKNEKVAKNAHQILPEIRYAEMEYIISLEFNLFYQTMAT